MTMAMRRRIGLLAMVAAATGLAACGAGSGEAGDGGGTVHVYSVAVPPQNESLLSAFNEAHPEIDVEITRGASELPARVDAEIAGGTSGADVMIYAGNAWYLANEDNLATLESAAADSWPEDAWAVPGRAPAVSIVPQGMMVWNTNIYPDGFEGWEDLLAPEVSGSLGIRDQVDDVVTSYFSWLKDVNGEDYLDRLAEQDPRFYSSLVPMTQAVASGEIGVANGSAPAVIQELQDGGAPIDHVIPDGGWGTAYYAGILSKSESQEAAATFVEFLMSDEGQAAFNGDGFAGSALEGVDGTVDVTGISLLDAQVTTPEVVDEFRAEYRATFNHG